MKSRRFRSGACHVACLLVLDTRSADRFQGTKYCVTTTKMCVFTISRLVSTFPIAGIWVFNVLSIAKKCFNFDYWRREFSTEAIFHPAKQWNSGSSTAYLTNTVTKIPYNLESYMFPVCLKTKCVSPCMKWRRNNASTCDFLWRWDEKVRSAWWLPAQRRMRSGSNEDFADLPRI